MEGGPALVDAGVLDVLLEAAEPVGVDALGANGGRELERLEAAGCELERHPQRGVRLLSAGLSVWADYLAVYPPARSDSGDGDRVSPLKRDGPGCDRRVGRRVGRRVVVLRETASTQAVARELAEAGSAGVVLADAQSAGRGRLGRSWASPAGAGVLMSMVLEDGGVAGEALSLAVGVAVARVVERWAGAGLAEMRWPNDVLVGEKKVAGVLIERVAGRVVVGVGLNVHRPDEGWPREVEGVAVALDELRVTGAVHRLAVVRELVAGIEGMDAGDARVGGVIEFWRARCVQLGRRVVLMSDGKEVRGEVVAIDPAQGLAVRGERGAVVYVPAATARNVVEG
ncbi:MAG: biotin--[acetyl-CoA-carboxylase] ligase [Planctomycetota bacterium]